jgi:dTDP-L-rhamnose 4-epimerase
MSKQILITGGAGFVGSHLADGLLKAGHQVRILDDLTPQVHPLGRPDYLSKDVELISGDIRDPNRLKEALAGVDVVYHFAATVGVGQSMYEIARYMRQRYTSSSGWASTRNPAERSIASTQARFGTHQFVSS